MKKRISLYDFKRLYFTHNQFYDYKYEYPMDQILAMSTYRIIARSNTIMAMLDEYASVDIDVEESYNEEGYYEYSFEYSHDFYFTVKSYNKLF